MSSEVATHDEVIAHLNSHFDKINKLSLKEIVGNLMIHVIPSSPERDHIILATSGANIRNRQERYELLMYLPKDWDISGLNDHWVVAWLRKLAYYDKRVSSGDTFSNEETYEPLATDTRLSGFLILSDPNDYGTFESSNGTTISFLDLIPLYKEEIELKQKAGTVELLERFLKNDITMVIDMARPNVGL